MQFVLRSVKFFHEKQRRVVVVLMQEGVDLHKN